MSFMVIEHFKAGPGPVYDRAAVHGRMLPDGLAFIDSWMVDDERMDRCFQTMHAGDPALFDVWIERWQDLVDFQVIPVISPRQPPTPTRPSVKTSSPAVMAVNSKRFTNLATPGVR